MPEEVFGTMMVTQEEFEVQRKVFSKEIEKLQLQVEELTEKLSKAMDDMFHHEEVSKSMTYEQDDDITFEFTQ